MNKEKVLKAMPTVLFITGIAGIFVSEILTIRATAKAKDILTRERTVVMKGDEETVVSYTHVNDKGFEESQVIAVCDTRKDYIVEVAKATWKCFIPPTISTVLTLASFIASRQLTKREIALLSSALASTAGLVTRYRQEILDRTNEEVLSEIDQAVASAEYKNAKRVTDISTGHLAHSEHFNPSEDGEYIFFDPLTKCKFRSTKLMMNSARYYLNRNFSLGCSVPLEMFYNFCGVDLPEEYRFMEWDADKIFDGGYCWIDIDFVRSEEPDPETGEQYYIIEYSFDPGELDDGPYTYPFGNPIETEGSYVRN